MKTLTQEQFWAACDANMSDPLTLEQADLSKPFVYDREYGLFYVPCAYHQLALAQLFAWHTGFVKAYDAIDAFKMRDSSQAADKLFENFPGIAILSSVGVTVHAFNKNSLTQREKDFFGKITYME